MSDGDPGARRTPPSSDRRPVAPATRRNTLGALVALPLLGTGVRALGSALGVAWLTMPLLAVAHVPLVIVLLGVWSIGCDLCRSG